ncbi:nitroreductase family protein [Vallitalea maricola]|uniref:Nitroreductase family protein n=1 Tax=Vallitalea maricola TaxID=3074433 RepID=A0ACB5UGH2_9FIRM|nr:nitroreductase family protein [Vallitalea sp. AN17-2]
MDMIYDRYSVRKYLKQDLNDKQKEYLDNITKYEQQGILGNKVNVKLIKPNTKHLKFSYGMIRGMAGYMYGYVDYSTNGYIDYGYIMEKNILGMTRMNIGTCWLGGTFNKKFFCGESKMGNKIVPAVIAYGAYESKRKDKARKRKGFEEIIFDKELGNSLSISRDDVLYDAYEAVRLAPSALNKQPWRLVKKDNIIRFYQNTKSVEMNLGNIDMGIGMAHFEYGLNINKINYSWIKEDIEEIKDYIYCMSIKI